MEFLQEISTNWYIIFIFTAFVAGYVDAIAGGGGMIQIPVLLLGGLPPIVVLATNKIVSMFGTAMAVIKYTINKKIVWKVALIAIIPCLAASYAGSLIIMLLSKELISWLIILSILVALLILFQKRKSIQLGQTKITNSNIISTTAPIGFYDGLLGPGTGTYFAISMNKFLHLDFLHSTATAKPLNFATNFGAAIAFIGAGKVAWIIATPMIIANVAGAYIGTHYAIKGGEAFIKRLMVIVLVVMLGANIIKLVSGN